MRPLVLVVLVLLAGCTRSHPVPTSGPADHFLVDPPDPDIEPPYDIIAADLRELNGSLVLTLEFENFTTPNGAQIPKFDARLRVEADDADKEYFVKDEPDFRKPAPFIRYVFGRVGAPETEIETCAIVSTNYPPWTIQLDVPHNATGLLGGGRITHVGVTTSDFENHTKDEASLERAFDVRGGPNPHDTCPLVAERPQ